LSRLNSPCEFLAWDSEFFGHRIARVISHRLDPDGLANILSWCARNKIDGLYFLADPDHDATVVLAEQNGFHLVDMRLTLALDQIEKASAPGSGPDSIQIRPAHSSDIAGLENIARTAHGDTRFYYDQRFASRCSDLYATWLRRSYEGFADQVLVAEYAGQPRGYITCRLDNNDEMSGHIGLVGVDATARGKGIGQALVRCSLCWFADQGVQQARVVTQARNVSAQRLYQRCGFVTHSLQMWYHKWFGISQAGFTSL